jgi:hypothetical protein
MDTDCFPSLNYHLKSIFFLKNLLFSFLSFTLSIVYLFFPLNFSVQDTLISVVV